MRRDAVPLIERLQRQTLDEERATLAAAQRRVTALETALAELGAERRDEIDRRLDDPVLLGRYLERVRQRQVVLVSDLEEATAARDRQTQRVSDARVRLRQVARLAVLRARRAAGEAGAARGASSTTSP